MISFNLSKTLGTKHNAVALHFSGQIEHGQIVAIHGVSGAGKTTLLKMLAGLITPDAGSIEVQGSTWFSSNKRVNISTRNRSIGLVFQDYALFPNMSVIENLEYGLDASFGREFVNRIIQITDIKDLLRLMPASLSGGQRQRVAFARAVVRKPKLLLLDEPLSALDVGLRSVLQNELLELRKLLDITILFTSHSVPEVYKLADRVMLIKEGAIVQTGTPAQVFTNGDTSVDAVGEFLSIRDVGQRKQLSIMVDGKVVSVDLDESFDR